MEKPKDGIWIIDGEGNTAYANGRMAEILRTTPEEMSGKPSFTYVFPEDISGAERLFDAKKSGDTKPFQFRLRCQDGSSVAVQVLGIPMRSPGGVFLGIVGTFTVSE